jgi:hypothetical protein
MIDEEIKPYENQLTLDELRREVRRCWNLEHDLSDAIRDKAKMPSSRVLMYLSRGSRWPDDWNVGKRLQREMGLDVIPPKTECECGAGVWYRVHLGLTLNDD